MKIMEAIAAAYGSSDEEEGVEKGYHLIPVGGDQLEEFLHKREKLKQVTLARRVRKVKNNLCIFNHEAASTYSRKRTADGDSKVRCVLNR